MGLSSDTKQQMCVWFCGFLFIAAAATICLELGYPELQSVHEARVVATARTMVRSGDWVVPVFNDKIRLEKPPLPYWCVGLMYALTGKIDETVARLPSVAAGIAGAALAAAAAAVTFGQTAGFLAGLFTLLMLRYQIDARTAQVDIYLTFCATVCFWLISVICYGRKRRDWLWVIFGAAVALGGLAKGPAIFVFALPMAIAAFWLEPQRRPRWFWLIGCAAIFLLLSAIWPALLIKQLGWDAVKSVWFSDMARNIAWTQRRILPFYYYLPRFFMLTFPWSVLAGAAIALPLWKEARAQKEFWRKTLWISLSVIAAIVVLSFARKKKLDYLVPIAPMMGALIAAAFERIVANSYSNAQQSKANKWLLYGQTGIFVAAGILGALFIPLDPMGRTGLLAAMSAAVLCGGIFAILYLKKDWLFSALLSQCIGLIIFMAGLYGQFVVGESSRISPGQFCQTMVSLIGDAPVVYYKGFDETLVYHLDRTIYQADNLDELTQFLHRYPNAFVVCRHRDLEEAKIAAPNMALHHPRMRDMELPIPKTIFNWIGKRYHAQDETQMGDSGYYYNVYVLTAAPWNQPPFVFEAIVPRQPPWLKKETIWVAFGLLAQSMFFLRFVVQWLASEKAKMSVVPVGFWWLSVVGGLMLLVYSVWRKDPVFIIGQSTGVFIYLRNLWLIYISPKPHPQNQKTNYESR